MNPLNLVQKFTPDDAVLHAPPSSVVFAFYSPMLSFPIMARRPRPPDEVLSPKGSHDPCSNACQMMSVTAVQDFYRERIFRVPDEGQGISRGREGDSGAGPGMETDAEVALSASEAQTILTKFKVDYLT